MPASFTPALDRFVHALHRRLVVVRFLERVALSLALVCALWLPMLALLAWRDAPVVVPTLLAISLGGAAGAVWAFSRTPTVLQAVLLADRQLELSDLLGSAWLVRDNAGPGLNQEVVAAAEGRCRQLLPSAVMLHRFGVRAWGGVSLSVILVLTVTLMTATPDRTIAEQNVRGGEGPAVAGPADDGRPLLDPLALGERPRVALAEAQDADDGASRPRDSHLPEEASSPTAMSRQSSNGSVSPAGASRSGSGLARSVSPPADSTDPPAAAHGSLTSTTGKPLGGNAEASRGGSTEGDGRATGRVAVSSAPAATSAPWQDADWPQKVDAADRAVRSGEVPPEYRDLVRKYFAR